MHAYDGLTQHHGNNLQSSPSSAGSMKHHPASTSSVRPSILCSGMT